MFPTLADVSKLIDDAKNLRISATLRDAAAIQVKVADTIDLFLDPTAPKQACDMTEHIACLESCKAELQAKGAVGPDGKNITPGEIIAIINIVVALLQKIHDWRHPTA